MALILPWKTTDQSLKYIVHYRSFFNSINFDAATVTEVDGLYKIWIIKFPNGGGNWLSEKFDTLDEAKYYADVYLKSMGHQLLTEKMMAMI